MRIAIATDAWMPQVNGVVRTLTATIGQMIDRGYEVEVIAPDQFLSMPIPGYSEIRLAIAPRLRTRRLLRAFCPDIVHIVSEGPIGWSARRWCLDHNVPFTSAFHTRFPDYAAVRTGLSPDRFWPLMRRFHAPSRGVLCATPGLMSELGARGITNCRLWSRGTDTSLFRPDQTKHPALAKLARPIFLSVGRVAVEKNLDAFLRATVAGTKIIVGDGPALNDMKTRYPDAIFMGVLQGEALAQAYAAADVFVFPSLTDTFGLVMIEALASGAPVAGFPVPGPLDIVGPQGCGPNGDLMRPVGILNDDLAYAIDAALTLRRADAASYGKSFDWSACTDQFIDALSEAHFGANMPREAA
jgi:glycosyltransferase involved in cell wall biosynthesis